MGKMEALITIGYVGNTGETLERDSSLINEMNDGHW